MREVIQTVLAQIRAIWHFRWHALMVAWFVSVTGWLYVVLMPDMYKASARVYVETNSVLKPLLSDLTVQTNVLSAVELMRNALLGRPTLERLANETGLDRRAKNEYEFEALINELKERIAIRHDRDGQNLYWIEYMDADPAMAEKLVATLLDGFMDSIQGSSRSDNTRAQAFLDEQIKEYEGRLEEAENRLKEFKLANVGHMPSEGVDFYQRLQISMKDLEDVKLELREAKQALSALNRQVEGEEPTFGFSSVDLENNESRAIDVRINQMQQQLDELSLQYTEEHPDVAQILQTIAQLEKKKKKITDDLARFGNTQRAEQNPIYQQLDISRGAKEAEVASLTVRQQEYEQRVAELQDMVDKVPAVEAELAKLNRDYNVVKTQYETMLARREAAKLSSDVERLSDDVQFKVIDPPLVPSKPAWPNRIIFNTLVLMLAVSAGVGFGYLMTQFIPIYHTSRELSSLGLPLLGVISMHMDQRMLEHKHKRLKQFFGAGSALFCIYIVVLMV